MPAPSPTSLIDRVDDTDEPIGVVPRRDVFREHAGFRVAHVFVFSQAGDLLIQRVSHERERSPLLLGSSVAAYLFAGESYAEAARRRLREELGLTTPLQKLGSTTMDDGGARKFIDLFRTTSDEASIADEHHIESLLYLSVPEIQEMLRSEPEQFTETFPHVFRLYRAIVSTE
jgi:isopentenyl-diphosphate Delta-isomerase